MKISQWAFAAAAMASGCSVQDSSPAPDARAGASKARVVVADIDTGINPYHAFYNAYLSKRYSSPIYPEGSPPSSVTPEVLAEFGIDDAHVLTLTRTGSFQKDFAADAALWAGVKRGELYWFRGTNIIAVGLDTAGPLILPNSEDDTHGVGTSSAVLTANPDAILLFVEAADQLGSEETHRYAFLNPAVDVITTSYGLGAEGVFPPEVNAFFHSFEGVVTLGKLHFSSGGNSPGFTPGRAGAGPWWSIGIDGFEEGSSNGRTTVSGVFPDFVADFTQDLPYCKACESGTSVVGGTSFSTPRSAGVASKLILEARRALGHEGGITRVDGKPVMAAGAGTAISNWQVRRALEEGAWVATIADYDPVQGVTDLGGQPVNDAAPWLQVGWGELSADPKKRVVEEALATLGFGTRQRAKDPGFCDFQTQIIQERHAYWDNVSPIGGMLPDPLAGDSVGDYGADPFIYCGSALP